MDTRELRCCNVELFAIDTRVVDVNVQVAHDSKVLLDDHRMLAGAADQELQYLCSE